VTQSTAPPAFHLPAALSSHGFTLRPELDSDIPFVMQLYASTREAELASVAWSAEEKQAFLAQQFAAQRHHYRTVLANCTFEVIEQDGVPAGRLYLEEHDTQIHVVDIVLAAAWRGQGVGTAILRALIDHAATRGRGVGIFVEKFNPALKLYRRLGFTEIDDTGVYLEMKRPFDRANAGVA